MGFQEGEFFKIKNKNTFSMCKRVRVRDWILRYGKRGTRSEIFIGLRQIIMGLGPIMKILKFDFVVNLWVVINS